MAQKSKSQYQMGNHRGFSLMELMVVVALIAVVSTIAVPSYQSYKRKAKLVAAKQLLAYTFELQEVFKGEHGQYTSRLDSLGFRLDGATDFSIGFVIDFPPPAGVTSYGDECIFSCFCPTLTAFVKCSPAAMDAGSDFAEVSYVTANSFVAEAHSHLDFPTNTDLVTFTIDNKKDLKEVIPGQ